MNKHTKGPWKVGRALSSGQECIVGDGDSVVALMPDVTMGCTFNAHDARLIAAAPKLLEALQRCKFDSLNMSLADLDFCRAAIAAATGESQ